MVGAAWLALWIFSASLSNTDTFYRQSINEVWRVLFLIPVNYVFFQFSVPFITRKRSNVVLNILAGILMFTIQLVLLSFGLYVWKWLGIQLHVFTQLRQVTLDPDTPFHRIAEEVMYQAQGGITSLFFFGIATLVYDNFRLKQTAQRLQLEKKEAELNFLKSQTNPHFLFNTLNNIYSLSRDKSDLAPESVLRLSKILRFMLYETGNAFITLAQELEIIHDYINLEKLRYDETLSVNYHQNIDDVSQPVPPLLLIPLVENAFKHGASESGNVARIDIDLSVKGRRLTFVVRNSTEQLQNESAVKENIGLSNLRRQLALLYSEYDLDVEQRNDEFKVTLSINLASHG